MPNFAIFRDVRTEREGIVSKSHTLLAVLQFALNTAAATAKQNEALGNVAKTKHESAKSIIRNQR